MLHGSNHYPRLSRTVPGDANDCFHEMPNYILRVPALAQEDGLMLDDCMKLCAAAKRKYGKDCRSFQFFYIPGTCVVNSEDRYVSTAILS